MIDFNNSQCLGLDLDKHIALDAGAGTGKTTVMAERYVQHLLAIEQRATHVTPPGPRVPLTGYGSLRAPKRERTDVEAWQGLLPSEVVAISFTRKAAAELKARIRQRLALCRATPHTHTDREGMYDPRLRSDADVEMLLSGLDEAPISTIDAFLHRLVQPYIDSVALYPSNEQLPEDKKPLMLRDTMHAIWRIRTTDDAHEAGVLNHHTTFIQARNRLTVRLGGQELAETVVGGLMDASLFVEQSHRSMIQRAQDAGLDWNGRGPAPVQLILDMIVEPVQDRLPLFVSNLHDSLTQWVDTFLLHPRLFIDPTWATEQLTRFHHLIRLSREPCPTHPIEQLRWIWKLMMGISSWSSLKGGTESYFPRGNLPNSDGWPAGLLVKSKVKGPSGFDVAAHFALASVHRDSISDSLKTDDGRLIALLAKAMFTLQPGDGYDGMPLDSSMRRQGLIEPIPQHVDGGQYYITADLQMQVLSDLIVVHQGAQQILARRKSLEGMHDFDDLQRFAADLLLARCPDVCRHRYPSDVIDALDGLGDEPWSDAHISRALTMLNDEPALQQDLHRRISVLSELRRQFRAFIIDEYQDTNPAHFRLLARLWGRRAHRSDDPQRPLGDWDPTVCIVGDMKQSIYRFRQAEVSVMRRAVASIREINQIEVGDTRLNHLREDDHGRDPRPVGAGGEHGSYSNEHDGEISAPHTFVPLGAEDGEETITITGERLQRRREGHIDLTSNHRTRHDLMETMNDIFDEVFDERYHELPGDWHAEPQRLRPARQTDQGGLLEWLLPIQGELEPVSLDLDVPINPFQDPNTSPVHLEHELIAARLDALFQHSATQVWNSEEGQWHSVEETGSPVRPEDVMILINSRTHLPDLLTRLRARNIPVMADRQGLLLMQPTVQPLMAMLGVLAQSTNSTAGIELARSPVVGMTETQVHATFHDTHGGQSMLTLLRNHAPSEGVAALLGHLEQLASWGAIYDVFDAMLDHSDLLIAYPEDSHRQHAESWCAMVQSIGVEVGHDVAAIHHRMMELRSLEKDGPKAITKIGSEAVQIMTIHGAKGLQAPVVIAAGLFNAGKSDASNSVKDNVLVTPQVVAGRIQPWLGQDRPMDGLWSFASQMNKAQDKAELRRKFYVALTRVKDRLIVTGSPGNTSTFDAESGVLSVKLQPDPRSMGRMLVEGIRRASWRAGDVTSPWLSQDDLTMEELPPFVPAKTEQPLNPHQLLENGQLGEEGLSGLRLYHHPDCFHQETPPSPQQRLRMMQQDLLAEPSGQPEAPHNPLRLSENLSGAAHHLDATHECKRKYWLEHAKGWPTEPFNLVPSTPDDESMKTWPTPTTFGLMMHRVLEIGLRNPRNQQDSTPPLSRDWQHENEGILAQSGTVTQVLSEFGVEEGEHPMYDAWAERLHQLSKLIDRGLLGQWVAGEHRHGYSVEAVRTELPFSYTHAIDLVDHVRHGFTPRGPLPKAIIERVFMKFNGRADLVLALADDDGQGYLQVVDLKTRGCLHPFNSTSPDHGHTLQKNPPELTDPSHQSDEEQAILHAHRLQLTLYSMVLEAIEANKPDHEQRIVLPPALLLGANGRMLNLGSDDFKDAKDDLNADLEWRALLHVAQEGADEPPRLPAASALCQTCPFYMGDVRRCAPAGEPLGFIPE